MNADDMRGLLDNTFGSDAEYREWAIGKYQEMYSLPNLQRTEDVPPRLFQHYQRGRHFVVTAAANPAGELLITKDIAQIENEWQLPGGFAKDGEHIEDACERIITEQTGLKINEIEPLAVVVNKFRCHSRELEHRGIAFLVHTSGTLRLPHGHLGAFIAQPIEQLAYSNREIAVAALEKISARRSFCPEDEIGVAERYALNYSLHKLLISKPLKWLSSGPLGRTVTDFCGGADYVLDVACGDDELILDLAKSVRFCVANDVSWPTLRRLRKKCTQTNVMFTNHDATSLPFRSKFDVVICKNMMHHMHNAAELQELLESLAGLGNKLILMDIENPSKSTLESRFWHYYYVRFLGDRGAFFLTRCEFEKVVSSVFGSRSLVFGVVPTHKGNYMYAVVEC